MNQAYKIPFIDVFRNKHLSGSIFRVLAYFDVFDYPLTVLEILEYCDFKEVSMDDLLTELKSLVEDKFINNKGEYYFIGSESCISKREKANRYSEKLLKKSDRFSRLISGFPFVRGVCISGSLAKNNAHSDADVDYFIITEANRLWVCRTLLTLYKKIFLLNSRKYFCINYFVDTNNLEIIDKNLYTATEIAFLMPVYSQENFFRFLAENTWVSQYYPGKMIEVSSKIKRSKDGRLKKAAEFLLDNMLGNFLDDICLKLTLLYRQHKFRNLGENEFNTNMRALKGVSKHHPHSFQNKVLRKYHEKLVALEAKFGLGLN